MDDDSGSKEQPSNPCCLNWKQKYTKLKERNTKLEGGRNALKQGISIYQQQIDKVEKEKEGLLKAYQDEKTRADNEKENKDKECALRVTLEAEISTLKSEILSLSQHGGQVPEDLSQEIECLRCHVSERDTEINRLKDLVEKEKTRADVEITKAQKEKKKAEESAKKVQVPEDVSQELECLRCRVSESDTEINRLKDLLEKEKTRADVEITKAQKEKKKAEESAKKVQVPEDVCQELECLRCRVSESDTEINRLKDLLEKEKTRADVEITKAQKEKKKAEKSAKTVQVPEDVSQELECLRCRVSESDTEINRLKDLLEKEKTRADVETTKAQKEKKKAEESANKKVQVPKDVSQELEGLRCRVSESDTEINRLKDLLEKEKTRADVEITKAQKEKKKAEESAKKVKGEKSKVNDLKKVADMERKKAEELKLQIVALQSDAEEAKSKLTLETEKLKEANNMLRAEKEKTDAERKRSELQMAKVEEQRKVAESNLKLVITEKNRANHMSEQLDKTTRRLKELEKELMEISSERIKLASARNQLKGEITNEASKKEINEKGAHKKLEKVTQKLKKEKRRAEYERKKAEEQRQLAEKASMEGKFHADQLARELQHYKQRVEEMGKEIQKLRLPTALLESFSHPSSGSLQTVEIKILKKQLKLEKIRLKHAKQIAKVEIGRNQLLWQETLLLKQDLFKYSQRLDTLDSYLLRSYGGIDEPEKLQSLRLQREHIGVEACERNLHANGLTKTSATSSGTAVSALLEVEPIVSGLSGGTIKGNNEKLASRNVNIDGSPIVQTARKTRKRLRDAHEPNFVGHSLQQQVFEKSSSQGILNHQTDKIPYENKLVVAHGDSTVMMDQSKNHKKMKSASRNTPALVDLSDADELKAKPDNLCISAPSVLKQHNLCISSPPEVDNLTTLTQVGIDVLGEDHSRSQHWPGDFDEFFCGDILKLLDLDDDGYEERYRKAIQRPLSPTLPQIEFKSSEAPELRNPTYLSMENSYEGVSNRKEDLESYCSFDVMNLEIDANTKDSSLPVTHLSTGISENLHKNDNNDQNAVSRIGHPLKSCMTVTGSTVSEEQNRIVHTGNEDAPVCGVFLKYCVIFSENTENCSMRRVYLATSGCLTELLGSESTFLQSVLPSIWKADDLTAKERVSVFFSLLLHYISDVAKADLEEKLDSESVQLLKSFAQQICSVLSDASSRRLLIQIDVQELFFLIEDFLLNGKIVTNDFIFKETTVGCPSMSNVATDSSLSLSIQEASIPLLLVGGVVLSSVCAATGHIGFLCEVSVNILRIQLLNSWVIKLLHIFAYICGTNYLELEDQSLEISVLKCLVALSENMNSPKHSTACIPPIFINSSQYSSCANCPFANGVASVDDIAVLLLDKLQVYASSGTSNMLNGRHLSNRVGNEAASSVNAHSSLFCLDEDMGHCVDILSLLELVACVMSWEWTCSNVVAPLVKILDSSVTEHVSYSVITLLDQLGRFGIDAKGYSDSGVENLRDWLCNRLSRSYTSEFGLHYQFAVATALVGLNETPFEEIIRSDSDPPVGVISQSSGASSKCIREWFSSLNAEQMSSLRLLLVSCSSKCKLKV